MRNNFPKYSVPTLNTAAAAPLSLSTTLSDNANYSASISVNTLGKAGYFPSNTLSMPSTSLTPNNLSHPNTRPPMLQDQFHVIESLPQYDSHLFTNTLFPQQQMQQFPGYQSLHPSVPQLSYNPAYPILDTRTPSTELLKSFQHPGEREFHSYIPKDEVGEFNPYLHDTYSYSPISKYRLP